MLLHSSHYRLFMPPVWLFLCCSLVGCTSEEAVRPPNIIYILADDLGYNEVGAYGQEWIQTPHIDRIAREGMRFTRHYSGNAVCAPSRCNLMTGKHPGSAYIRNNGDPKHLQHMKDEFGWEFPGQNPIPVEEVTIAEMLKQKGYATAAIGKWGLGHFGTTGDPNAQGFDLFYGFNCQRHAHNHYPRFLWHNREKELFPGNDRTLHGATYSQDRFIDVALDFIDAHQEEPFFLYLPFAIPHLSIQAPDSSVLPYTETLPEEPYTDNGYYLRHPTPRAAYAGMITHMDAGIGAIMERIAALGLDEDTIIMFSSDNGPTFNRLGGSDSEFFASAGSFKGLKGSLYEGGIRVPFVARWPGAIEPGTTSDHMSAFWDIMPTIADLTGTTPPEDIDGISLAPTLLNTDEQVAHAYLYWEFPGYGGQQAARQGDWKAIRQNMLRDNNATPLKIELYNLADDIGETNNVAELHPEKVAAFERIFEEAHTPSALFPMTPIDE